MRILLKDYATNKRSITVTAWVATFLLAFATIVLGVVGQISGRWVIPIPLIMTAIVFNMSYVGLYWKKRTKVSLDGVEIDDYPK